MEQIVENNFISIIDYIGKINDGVAVLLSMNINDNIYELVYWFDPENNYILTADKKFLQDYEINNIYEYKNFNKLLYFIHNFVLYNKEEIFKEFLK